MQIEKPVTPPRSNFSWTLYYSFQERIIEKKNEINMPWMNSLVHYWSKRLNGFDCNRNWKIYFYYIKYRETWYLHVKLNLICEDVNVVIWAIKFTEFNNFGCWTNLDLLLYDRNIFKDCLEFSATFGNLRKISGHLRKFSENDRKCSQEHLKVLRIFGNLWEIAKISLILLFI